MTTQLVTRPLRIAKDTFIARLVIHQLPYIVTNPMTCRAGVKYQVHLDADKGTATITEVAS